MFARRALSLIVASVLLATCADSGLVDPGSPPTLTGISMGEVMSGTTVTMTLVGTGFVAGQTQVVISGPDISVLSVLVTSATSLTVDVAIGEGAQPGEREVVVTTPSGTSQALTFIVRAATPAAPTLSGITPGAGNQGTTVPVTLAGSGFGSGEIAVAVRGGGVAVEGVEVIDDGTATAEFQIAADAEPGAREVTVTTAGGRSNPQTFTVAPPAPTLVGLSPDSGSPGTTVSVTLAGSDFVAGGTTVSVSGEGVAASGIAVVSPTAMTATFTVASDAAVGAREVRVTTAGGTSEPQPFHVLRSGAVVTGIDPAAGGRGRTERVRVTGNGFVAGATDVTVSGSGVAVQGVTVQSASSLEADFVIDSEAALGDRTVTVTTPGGSGQLTFRVLPAEPRLVEITPAAGAPGATVTVAMLGEHFVEGATEVLVEGDAGVTVENVTVTSETRLTAEFVVAGSAAEGGRTVRVSTAGGTSGALRFSVGPPPPTLTELRPFAGAIGATTTVAFEGSNFVTGETQVSVGGTGITVQNVQVASATSLTAEFVVAGDVVQGAREVRVTTPTGTSGAVAFHVRNAPTLSSITPTSGYRGATTTVTLTGTEFFAGGTTVDVSGTGVTVSNVVVNSSTSLTADLTLDGTTALGARNVTVTTAGGTTSAATFTLLQPSGSATFNYTGGQQNFVVPVGVTTVTVQAFGAEGGAGDRGGGLGGSVTATVTVTPGETLGIFVGGKGGDDVTAGFNGGGAGGNGPGNDGGGGGGASDVRQGGIALTDRIVVAGGGGGGGAGPTGGAVAGAGGAGGGLVGAAGDNGSDGAVGGGGGTQAGGGTGGAGSSGGDPGAAGALGVGGTGGGNTVDEGGGGGGGYYGGGGGGEEGNLAMGGAGGGGGSSFAIGTATNVTHQQGVRSGDGQILLTW